MSFWGLSMLVSRIQAFFVAGVLLSLLAGCVAPTPVAHDPELLPVKTRSLQRGFLRSGIDFSYYDQVIVSEPVIAFATPDKTQNPFTVTAKQRSQLVGMMRKSLRSAFSNANNFALVESPSSTALRLDVRIESIGVPKASSGTGAAVGRSGIFTPIDGKARVVLELSDAESHEILAMAVDDQLVSGTAIVEDGEYVSTWAEAAEVCDRWAKAALEATDTLLAGE